MAKVLQFVYHDPVMTLTQFMVRSAWVAHAFEWGKTVKMSFEGKSKQKIGKGQNIDYSEKKKISQGLHLPLPGVKYHNIQTCLLVYAADLR